MSDRNLPGAYERLGVRFWARREGRFPSDPGAPCNAIRSCGLLLSVGDTDMTNDFLLHALVRCTTCCAMRQRSGGGDGPPANAQDVDGDGLQDCWSALTSNEDAEITSELGYRDLDDDGQDEFHNGIDIGVATGTALYAAKSGIVVETEDRLAENATSYVNALDETVEVANGNFVRINWADGTQGVYLHMLSVRDFGDDDLVAVGDYLGTSNNTGESGGPHLHYSEWKDQSDSRPDGAAGNPENFNDPEESHGNCGTEDGTDEGEPEGDA